jgi:hypothetical protein
VTTIDAPWGMGSYVDDSGTSGWLAVSVAEADREARAAARRLESWGVGPDDVVLVIAGVTEAVQFAPFQRAARAQGGISCTAEPSPFDARRTAAFLEQYELRAVIGLDHAVLDGLSEFGDPTEVLGRCPNLLVRSDAFERVAALGLAPAALHVLGPAVAVECPERAGGHVGVDAWTVGVDARGLWVEPAEGRDLEIGRVYPGRHGSVVREPCGCGSADPRVVVDRLS